MTVTYEDAKIFIDLVRWSTEMGLNEALTEIYADDFDATDGSIDSPAARTVLAFGETAGALVKHNVLAFELLSDLFWIEGMWAKVGARARFVREHQGEPRLYEHFEALAAMAAS